MRYRLAVPLVFLSFMASPASPQVPAGGEFQVDNVFSFTTSATADAAANFVVVWQSPNVGSPYPGWDVFARRYDASGAPRGAKFRVHTDYLLSQIAGQAASDAAGRFVVVWSSYFLDVPLRVREDENLGGGFGIFGRRYDASGVPQAAEFQVNTYTSSWGSPRLSCASRGGCLVVWESYRQDGRRFDIFARGYDASGAPRGSEFHVNTYTPGDQRAPSVTSDAVGNAVVVWSSGPDGSAGGVFGQRYDASGLPRGSEFRVNTYTTAGQPHPAVTSDAAGNFVVVWQSYSDGSGYGVFGQRYDATGVARGSEFQVNTYTTSQQSSPAVASDAAGDFVVAWDSSGQDGNGLGIFAQRYDASGARRGFEFRVNTTTSGSQRGPSATSDTVGNLVVAWTDSQQERATAQRFGVIVPAALGVDTATSAGSDGNRVFEPGESVDLRPSWRNVNGGPQTFDGSGLAFTGPAAAGVSYQRPDSAGAYGTVPNGSTAACTDCYQVAVTFSGTRPSLHWDASFTERLTPDALGQTKPWSIHMGESFSDVPKTSVYYRDIETLLHKGVTGGCTATTYCPTNPVTREQVAVFTLEGKEGSGYLPPACTTPMFSDVPASSFFCAWIEELARRGVVGGCGGGNYCPVGVVTREQLPVFVLRLLDPSLIPPPCATPVFADVPASSPFCRWIEELARRGVVGGCGGGNYCPTGRVTRDQMAVFVTGTFGLSLYGP